MSKGPRHKNRSFYILVIRLLGLDAFFLMGEGEFKKFKDIFLKYQIQKAQNFTFAIPRDSSILKNIMLLHFQLVLGLIVFPTSPGQAHVYLEPQNMNSFGSKVYAYMIS